MKEPRQKTFRRGVVISIVQQGIILALASQILDGGRIFRQMVWGALICWVALIICMLLARRKTWNEVHGYYFAKWCYIGIAAIIFAGAVSGYY